MKSDLLGQYSRKHCRVPNIFLGHIVLVPEIGVGGAMAGLLCAMLGLCATLVLMRSWTTSCIAESGFLECQTRTTVTLQILLDYYLFPLTPCKLPCHCNCKTKQIEEGGSPDAQKLQIKGDTEHIRQRDQAKGVHD